MVGVSASVNLPLHHKVQKFSSGTSLPGWSQKKGRKTVVALVVLSNVRVCKNANDLMRIKRIASKMTHKRVISGNDVAGPQ